MVRLIVSSDIGGSDPDDYQSLVHLLVYADRFTIEGLISSPPYAGRKQHMLETLDAYAQDYHKLEHYGGYPVPAYLQSVTKQGAIDVAPAQGVSSSTEGSRWIVERARASTAEPLYVLVWGSLTDVAQAVHDAPDIKTTIRVYSIGSWNTVQDPHARDYLYHNHADLWWIESNTTFRGMYVGGDQLGDYDNARFVSAHVSGHGALGDFYSGKKSSIKMGDSPSVLYLLHGDPEDPTGESWGGSYAKDTSRPHYWTDRSDLAEEGYNGAKTINRWRTDYLDDWKLRMDRVIQSSSRDS